MLRSNAGTHCSSPEKNTRTPFGSESSRVPFDFPAVETNYQQLTDDAQPVIGMEQTMPYWGIHCLHCQGYILDALLECVPAEQKRHSAYKLLFSGQAGAALACPYCNGLIGFDDSGLPRAAESGWPVFRYSEAELELKKQDDFEAPGTPLPVWALKHRFMQPGSHLPLVNYVFAELAPANEIVP